MSGHTKGPWEVQEYIDDSIEIIGDIREINEFSDEYTTIAELKPSGDLANARLIAAAPDLLEALEGLLEEAHTASKPLHRYSIYSNKARTAIARAKGEQP